MHIYVLGKSDLDTVRGLGCKDSQPRACIPSLPSPAAGDAGAAEHQLESRDGAAAAGRGVHAEGAARVRPALVRPGKQGFDEWGRLKLRIQIVHLSKFNLH